MGSINIFKPLSTFLKPAQHHWVTSATLIIFPLKNWEGLESNPGLLSEKQVCYPCAMQTSVLPLVWLLVRHPQPCGVILRNSGDLGRSLGALGSKILFSGGDFWTLPIYFFGTFLQNFFLWCLLTRVRFWWLERKGASNNKNGIV